MTGSVWRLAHLADGLVVPLPAVEAALAIERAGHRILTTPHFDVCIDRRGDIDAHDLAQFQLWRAEIRTFIVYIERDNRTDPGDGERS